MFRGPRSRLWGVYQGVVGKAGFETWYILSITARLRGEVLGSCLGLMVAILR